MRAGNKLFYFFMFLLLLLFITILFITGAAISFMSLAKYSTLVETEGEVTDYLMCNPDEERQLEEAGEERGSAAVISYIVDGKTYLLATNIKKIQKNGALSSVKILYDPYFPGQAQLKEGTPLLGLILTGISVICFVLLLLLF